jgi:hypothetical protein
LQNNIIINGNKVAKVVNSIVVAVLISTTLYNIRKHELKTIVSDNNNCLRDKIIGVAIHVLVGGDECICSGYETCAAAASEEETWLSSLFGSFSN